MKKKIVSSLLVLSMILLPGCFTFEGAGEAGLGYTSESRVYSYHTVDGDKEGKTATSSTDLSPLVDQFIRILESLAGTSTPTDKSRG